MVDNAKSRGGSGIGSTRRRRAERLWQCGRLLQSRDETLEQVVHAFAKANPGTAPLDPTELLPYATTPEQQTAVRQMNLANPIGK